MCVTHKRNHRSQRANRFNAQCMLLSKRRNAHECKYNAPEKEEKKKQIEILNIRKNNININNDGKNESKTNAAHIQMPLSHVAPNVIVIKYILYSVQVTCHLSSDTTKQQQQQQRQCQRNAISWRRRKRERKKIRKLSIGDWYSIQMLRNRHIIPHMYTASCTYLFASPITLAWYLCVFFFIWVARSERKVQTTRWAKNGMLNAI